MPKRRVWTGTGVSPGFVNFLDHVGSKDSVTGALADFFSAAVIFCFLLGEGLLLSVSLFGGVEARLDGLDFFVGLSLLLLLLDFVCWLGVGVTLIAVVCFDRSADEGEDEGARKLASAEVGKRADVTNMAAAAAFLGLRRSCGDAEK